MAETPPQVRAEDIGKVTGKTHSNPARFETDRVDVNLWLILTRGIGGCRGQVSPAAVRLPIPCEPLFWRQQDDHGKPWDRLCA